MNQQSLFPDFLDEVLRERIRYLSYISRNINFLYSNLQSINIRDNSDDNTGNNTDNNNIYNSFYPYDI